MYYLTDLLNKKNIKLTLNNEAFKIMIYTYRNNIKLSQVYLHLSSLCDRIYNRGTITLIEGRNFDRKITIKYNISESIEIKPELKTKYNLKFNI